MRLALNLTRNFLRYSSTFKQQLSAEESHAKKTLYLWKRISLFVALPCISYLTWKNLIAEEHHDEKREYVPWSHLRIRNKPFPWKDSDKTLFHNPMTNPGPNDSEDEMSEVVPKQSLLEKIGLYWQTYFFEDPVKRDEDREEHLRRMQKRVEQWREMRKIPEDHIQPGNLIVEFNSSPMNAYDDIINST